MKRTEPMLSSSDAGRELVSVQRYLGMAPSARTRVKSRVQDSARLP